MSGEPLVSVLMTAYNRELYIAEAIESVLSSLYENFELIIVDDGSSDNTVKIAESYQSKDERVKVYRNEENLGDYPNRNKAAKHASGKYIKYLDSDDIMYPHCLAVMVSSLESYPEAAYCLSSIADSDKPFPVMLSPKEAYIEHFSGYNHFDRSPASAMIKLEVFNNIGGFKAKRWIGDTELWYKLSQTYPLVKVPRDLVWDRQHENQEQKIEVSKENITLSSNLRKELFQKMMNDPACPLNEKEKSDVYSKIKKKALKNRLLSVAKSLRHFG